MSSLLFTPLDLRGITLRNRIGVAPMAQYSCPDGVPGAWHMVHLGCRAVGGAGLVLVEATSVSEAGRISPMDTGLYNETQVEAFRGITDFIRSQKSVPGVQLSHAGRKGSTPVPWVARGGLAPGQGGWPTLAPSALPFSPDHATPSEMTPAQMDGVVRDFAEATLRAVRAGFEVIELHMAHGYLLHQFVSPITNHRTDEYGGSPENRARFPLRVVRAVRDALPSHLPLLARLSATDWLEGGFDVASAVQLSAWLREAGVDLIDCSTGAIAPGSQGEAAPGFQVPFARDIRNGAGIATAAVGMITEFEQAEQVLQAGSADLVLLGRVLLEDPYWPMRAQWKLEQRDAWPSQYTRSVRRSARYV